jgi:hypothetical protein
VRGEEPAQHADSGLEERDGYVQVERNLTHDDPHCPPKLRAIAHDDKRVQRVYERQEGELGQAENFACATQRLQIAEWKGMLHVRVVPKREHSAHFFTKSNALCVAHACMKLLRAAKPSTRLRRAHLESVVTALVFVQALDKRAACTTPPAAFQENLGPSLAIATG